MDQHGKILDVIFRFINLEINFWIGAVSFTLLAAGLIIFAAVIFILFTLKKSYKTNAKILGFITHSITKTKNGENIIEDDYKLVYEYTNSDGVLTNEVGSDWSDTHSQHFTGCIVPVRVASSKNYDDIYLNTSDTIKIFFFVGSLLILMSSIVVYTMIKSLVFFVIIFTLSIMTVLGIGIYMYLHHKYSETKDLRPESKVFSLDEIKPLEEFPNTK